MHIISGIKRSRPYRRFRYRLIRNYLWMYYGPLRCARPFRLERYLIKPDPPVPIPVVCERRQLIFYPVSKTANSTIKQLFLELEGYPEPSSLAEIFRLVKKHKVPRPTLDSQQSKYSGYFRFTFVRNPWDRLVSCYLNKVVAPRPKVYESFRIYPKIRFNRMSFTDFVRFVHHVPDDLCDRHFRPQSACFNDKDVDFIGRFERFADDLAQVIERAKLDTHLLKYGDKYINKSRHRKPYTDYYTAETRRLVAEKYKDDIQRFGYRFGE